MESGIFPQSLLEGSTSTSPPHNQASCCKKPKSQRKLTYTPCSLTADLSTASPKHPSQVSKGGNMIVHSVGDFCLFNIFINIKIMAILTHLKIYGVGHGASAQ